MENKYFKLACEILKDIAVRRNDYTPFIAIMNEDNEFLLQMFDEMIDIFTKAREELVKGENK